MSGHSHWAGIRHKKAAADSKRGKLFSKLARRLTLVAKQGGGDPDTNIQLQYAVIDARAGNMPKESIDRAIKKGTGELGGEELFELTYEGYGPGGVALMIEAVTNNKNRTASEIRHIMDRSGGSLSGSGSTMWIFEKKGLIIVEAASADEDELMDVALESGADDMERVGESFQITTAPVDLEAVRQALEEKEIAIASAEITSLPQSTVNVDEATGRKIISLVEALDDNDDVQNVYANFELPESLLAEMS